MVDQLAIDVRGLSRHFGNFVAVKDLSFTVKQGEPNVLPAGANKPIVYTSVVLT